MGMTAKLAMLVLPLLLQLSATSSTQPDYDNNSNSTSTHIAIPLYRSNAFAGSGIQGSSLDEDGAVQKVARAVQASKARATALKTGLFRNQMQTATEKQKKDADPGFVESLNARSFGGYTMKISLGIPPQEISVIMDTGSDLVWVPCTRRYTCDGCQNTSEPVYLPGNSSSVNLITCADASCKKFHGNSTAPLCFNTGNCSATLSNCSNVVCPTYGIQYGKGSTAGLLLSETLTFEGQQEVKDFTVGCSLASSQQPNSGTGIAGFGRGSLSFPSQLGNGGNSFSYCLQSQRFDDEENITSTLRLGKAPNLHLNYIPFIINPRGSPYDVYYYIGLRAVTVGNRHLKLPFNLTTFDAKGNGGTIIDSGTTFTVVHQKILEQITGAFASQIDYNRSSRIEALSGLGLCYNVSGFEEFSLPKFGFNFKGGSAMELPLPNYFLAVTEDVICLTMVGSGGLQQTASGPAVVVGNFNQQNFHLLYDRQKNRLGFAPDNCADSI